MGLTAERAAQITEKLAKQIRDRNVVLASWEDYFNGKHRLEFASTEWRKFHADRFQDFSDNWCGVVGRAAAERRELHGLRLGDDVEVQSPDERALWDVWESVDGPAKSAAGWLSTTYLSTSYSMVWADSDNRPTLSWESPFEVIVDYDPETAQPRYALKLWSDDDRDNATLYTADEVWKWSRPRSSLILPSAWNSLAGGWMLREGTQAPVIPNPLGMLPIVEHPNRPQLTRGPISDIAGVVPMQNAVNLMWAYLFGAADFAGLPARVITGQAPPEMPILDANGQQIGTQPVSEEILKQGRLLWLTGQNSKIAQFEASKLDVFTAVVNVAVKHVMAQTQTPIHYIMGELGNVNGETLTAIELPLATKVRAGNKALTRPVREIFRRFAVVLGDLALADQCRVAIAQWKNPETMSDAQVSDAASKDKTIGWPFAAILERRYNLSQPEIARIQAMSEMDPELSLARELANGSV